MTEIEEVIKDALLYLKDNCLPSTFRAKFQYINDILKTALVNGIDYPSQELYDKSLELSTSHENRNERRSYIRLIDRIAKTNALDEFGFFLNEMPFPSKSEALENVSNYAYGKTQSLTISSLIVATKLRLEELDLTKSTVGQFVHTMRHIRSFLYSKGITEYSQAYLYMFIEKVNADFCNGNVKVWKRKIDYRTVNIMNEMAHTGTFEWKLFTKQGKSLIPELEVIRDEYRQSLVVRNLGKSIIGLHDLVFRKMIELGNIETIVDLRKLDVEKVMSISNSFSLCYSQRSICTIFPIFRQIIDWLHAKEMISKSLSPAIMSPLVQKEHTVPYFPKSQEAQLLDFIERGTLRDKAIVLLALRTGIRAIDICNLKLTDINWKEEWIEVVQRKTSKPLTLPLLDDVGNALFDYITKERPKHTKIPYVFLSALRPFRPLCNLYDVFRKACDGADIQPENKNVRGSHLFRYTIVNRLLEIGTPHQIITDVLGHESNESDKPYISMEENMLRKCGLNLETIGIKKWTI